MSSDSTSAEDAAKPRWQPIEPTQRRVLGVLVEKAKTTPEAYPLSLNALRTGCNQKNNRAPLMQLEEAQVEEALDELRKVGAVSLVQGSSRVDRYRHLAYDWLGVEKVELAVMAELLLRGAQTVGELRGRAARMEPIKGLSELQPTLDSLVAKGLIQYLSPPGRGAIVTHTLYLDREVEKVRREAGVASMETVSGPPAATNAVAHAPASSSVAQRPVAPAGEAAQLRGQLDTLRDELALLRRELDEARQEFTTTADTLRRDLDSLNEQLGN